MEMFLMALCMSLLGVAVTAIAFGAATREEASNVEAVPEAKPVPAFAPRAVLRRRDAGVRRRSRASRSKRCCSRSNATSAWNRRPRSRSSTAPTAQSLHSRTSSPLVH